ncbi:hypothetical protein FHS96_003751 [Sphingomonas zeicaulis]|uniref:hypothetical protein n=1 Tax=Sphingomonas zeicaulis TaxID=1632740 RepID=UPI003D261D4A
MFDAAVRHRTIRLECPRCRRVAVYDPHAIWWLFERRHWPGGLRVVGRHFHCRQCREQSGERVRPRVSASRDAPTHELPMPSLQQWHQALRRHR